MSNTPDSTELLPCPFCGQQDAFVEQLDSDASVVICQGLVGEHVACLARGPVGLQEHELEDQPGRNAAVREWNSRAQPADYQGKPVEYGPTPGCKQCQEAENCGLTDCPECDAQLCEDVNGDGVRPGSEES
ncbi:Lar family restriction alleviation protein [Pseudomonas viridiflava]|uniref:Lar family restriction alleviation protein n=1 Tax=Pseudomonas viridiflava TaxID=33069 RepID=UPI000F040D6B|nr:Lar family restriction alleviation protein [Pseudomonas viridiflava]